MFKYALIGYSDSSIVAFEIIEAEVDKDAAARALVFSEDREDLRMEEVIVWDLNLDSRVCTVLL